MQRCTAKRFYLNHTFGYSFSIAFSFYNLSSLDQTAYGFAKLYLSR